jgi:hypothetical protein
MHGEESVNGPTEESAVATVAEWPEGLAAVLQGAVDLARAAVEEFSGPDAVGDYLGVSYEDQTAATHRFLAHLPGYSGWQWAAVVAAYPGSGQATISEVVLVPGPTSLLAPEWVPWDQRVRQGDLSPGDLLPPAANDERLVPGFTSSGDPQVDETAAEVGLGRRWVMGLWGRADAAERWHGGDYGPDSAMARSTKRVCRDCGFFLPLAGSLGAMFGVCGNELSADGHVVDKQYGCGAHSDTPAPAGSGSPAYEPYDDGVLDVMAAPAPPADPPEAPAEVSEPAEESPEVVAEISETAEAPEPSDIPSETLSEAPSETPDAPAEPEAASDAPESATD